MIVSCSDDQVTDQVYDSVLTPEFTYDNTQDILPNVPITFTNTSLAEGTEIERVFWHFGYSGRGNWSDEYNPQPVSYKEAGDYTVTLTIWGKDGNKQSIKHNVVITPVNLAPKASFVYAPTDVNLNQEVEFTSTSTDSDGEIVKYKWTFSEGATYETQIVKHTFTKGGLQKVLLEVTDDRGAVGKVSKDIYVIGGENNGTGTKEDPWVIFSVDRWNEIAQSINGSGEYTANGFYILITDLNFTGKPFFAWNTFSGYFNGNNHLMTGLTAEGEQGPFGVFCANFGTIRNLAVEANFTGKSEHLGGVVGVNENGVVDGVTFKGNLTSSARRIGGIVGQNEGGVIVNCANLGGVIRGEGENCGGIAGGIAGGSGFIVNCYSWVESVNSTSHNIGGIVGYGGSDSFIINSYSTATDIKGDNNNNGALGYVKKCNVQNVYGNAALSPVIGYEKNSGKYVPSVWANATTGALTLDEMMAGVVVVPSSKAEKANFVEALNTGIDIFEANTMEQKPKGVVLRRWTSNGSYPVLVE